MKISEAPRCVRLPALVISIALVAGVSACSGTSGSGSGSSASTTAATSTPKTPSASATSPSATPSGSASAARSVAPVPVESNPPGDIPDNLAFVKYTNKPGGYAFTHPEGWAQTGSGTRVRFTDKLNGVIVDGLAASRPPTVATARATEIPRLQRAVPAFQLRTLSAVTLPAGQGVHIVFRRNSDPDSVTGKVYRDEVEEYLVFSSGRLVRMDLFGPVGADNVDAYRTMSQSLRIR